MAYKDLLSFVNTAEVNIAYCHPQGLWPISISSSHYLVKGPDFDDGVFDLFHESDCLAMMNCKSTHGAPLRHDQASRPQYESPGDL